MKKKTIIQLVVFAAIITGLYFFLFKGDSAETQIEVKTTNTKVTDVDLVVTATGTIEPTEQVDVGTQVSAEVKKIYVDFNSTVKKGQLLAELDKTNLAATVEDAKASYNSTVTERDYLQTVYDRQKELYDNKLLSKSDLDLAKYNLEKAKNQVIQSLSSLNKARTNLSYAEIYSPVDGVVLSREVDEGQTVAASYSTPTLFTIAQDLKQMQVEADVDEADIGTVKEGQRVTFTVDAFQGEVFEGEVIQVRLNPTVTSNVVTYTVVIKANNDELKLMPGLTATISIFTKEEKGVLTVEAKALNFKPDQTLINSYNQSNETLLEDKETTNGTKTLWILENGKIIAKKVQIGISDGVNVHVKSGLNENEKVIYSLAETEVQETDDSEGGSPFMPKPPGSNKKK